MREIAAGRDQTFDDKHLKVIAFTLGDSSPRTRRKMPLRAFRLYHVRAEAAALDRARSPAWCRGDPMVARHIRAKSNRVGSRGGSFF